VDLAVARRCEGEAGAPHPCLIGVSALTGLLTGVVAILLGHRRVSASR
jgi:hypothetical protein